MDFSDLITAACICLLAAGVFMCVMFIAARHIGRYDLVDVAWGLVFIVVAVTALLQANDTLTLNAVVLVLVVIWGLRLSRHIYGRLRATSSEDRRYVELRQKWQSNNERLAIFLRIYMVQALLATAVSLPVIILLSSKSEATVVWVAGGSAIWLMGFIIESLADRQLRTFIQNPLNKGRVMVYGLWKYSRHPNYFGELIMWWGVGVMTLGVPHGWIGLVGPALLSYLIIFVSGIPPTEKAFAGRTGWDEYKRRTSVLVPWFVRKGVM